MISEKFNRTKVIGVLALSSLACRVSDVFFTNDPLMNATRGALSTAALGIEVFGLKPIGDVLTKDDPRKGMLKTIAMLGLPMVAAAVSYEFPVVSYVLMGIAIMAALTDQTSR